MNDDANPSSLASCNAPGRNGAGPSWTEVVVAFNRLRFEPTTVEVRLGARVAFHNIDEADGTLTITASDGSFSSRPLATHGEWSYRFRTRGEHEYFIEEHPETKGKTVVR